MTVSISEATAFRMVGHHAPARNCTLERGKGCQPSQDWVGLSLLQVRLKYSSGHTTVMGWSVSPPKHMLESHPLVPQGVTLFER